MIRSFVLSVLLLTGLLGAAQKKIVVFQSDFGVKDGAVSEMKGVAMGVSPELKLFDLTHEIPAYNIWEAAYRLQQSVPYWPVGTVFVSVVDPGVGTSRKSVVLLTKTGEYIVTPDNGTLTLIAESLGIAAIREIDEAVNRRQDSKKSYTFHGRDVYAYTAARLAAGVISFEQVGPLLPKQEVVAIPYQHAVMEGLVIKGTIPVLDVQYGNVWTNIPGELFQKLGVRIGEPVAVRVFHGGKVVYQGEMPYMETFGAVAVGKPLAYLNSLLQLSFALNQGSFAATYGVASGGEWTVEVSKKS
ncbi:MAG TPA: S-adenosyl-l-methionine hydroxide adenosyltransferase family protein [Puia sp.]|nr:S-adenosyl-l-methionine hydroxide adenosyltransferase family protein [Puia sp.]